MVRELKGRVLLCNSTHPEATWEEKCTTPGSREAFLKLLPPQLLRPPQVGRSDKFTTCRNFFYLETPSSYTYQDPWSILYQGKHSYHTLLRITEGNRNQGITHPHNKYNVRYQLLELQSSQATMPRLKGKNITNSSQKTTPELSPHIRPWVRQHGWRTSKKKKTWNSPYEYDNGS